MVGEEDTAYHLCQPSRGDHVPRMHQAIKMPGTLLDLLAHILVDFHVEDIGHEIQSILVVLHFRIEACEVEAVREVVLVNFAEVFIAAGGYELHTMLVSTRSRR